MSNETKWDVFKDVVETLNVMDGAPIDDYCKDMINRYDDALPDNLPVVSKDVSNTMITYRFLWWKEFLDKSYDNELSGDEDINYKVRSESAEVARALIIGVWRVEETGEIVKLEAEL